MAVVFPTTESELKHIFRRSEGHVSDTPANRALLLEVANDQTARLEFDEQGNQWAARLLADGRQAWVRMRDGKIINAGINLVPRNFNSRTGLNRP
jgi:filamentous hemagglutinin